MDRLTAAIKGQIIPAAKDRIMCSNYCSHCGRADCDFIRDCLNRLVAYEDTGLTPENVRSVVWGRWVKREVLIPLARDCSPLDYDKYDGDSHSEWVEHWFCSECDTDFGSWKPSHNYCPSCGAEMVTNCRQLEEGEG